MYIILFLFTTINNQHFKYAYLLFFIYAVRKQLYALTSNNLNLLLNIKCVYTQKKFDISRTQFIFIAYKNKTFNLYFILYIYIILYGNYDSM